VSWGCRAFAGSVSAAGANAAGGHAAQLPWTHIGRIEGSCGPRSVQWQPAEHAAQQAQLVQRTRVCKSDSLLLGPFALYAGLLANDRTRGRVALFLVDSRYILPEFGFDRVALFLADALHIAAAGD
jgi:hypothetical protein